MLLLVIILPLCGFLITNILGYLLPTKRALIASLPTLLLFTNVCISIYLFYTIAFVEYNKIIMSQLAQSDKGVYYEASKVSLDFGT